VGASEVACCVMLLLWLLGRGLLEDEEEEEDEEPASAPARLASRSFGTCLLASSICCAIMLPAPPRPQGMMIGYGVGWGVCWKVWVWDIGIRDRNWLQFQLNEQFQRFEFRIEPC